MNIQNLFNCFETGIKLYLQDTHFGLFSIHHQSGKTRAENLLMQVNDIKADYLKEVDSDKKMEIEIKILALLDLYLNGPSDTSNTTLATFIYKKITGNAKNENDFITNVHRVFENYRFEFESLKKSNNFNFRLDQLLNSKMELHDKILRDLVKAELDDRKKKVRDKQKKQENQAFLDRQMEQVDFSDEKNGMSYCMQNK